MPLQANANGKKGGPRRAHRPQQVLLPAIPLAPIAPAMVPLAYSMAAALPPAQPLLQPHPHALPRVAAHAPLHLQPHPSPHQYHPHPQHPHPHLYHPQPQAPPVLVPAAPQFLPAPMIFMNTKLRCGKWAAAEEAYAVLLIEYFEKGFIVECENGVTLRSFLSRKLHCSPMRISKKYAGKGIGKKVFLSKLHSNSLAPGSMDRSEIPGAIAMLQAAEARFLKTLFPGCNIGQHQLAALMANPQCAFPHLVHPVHAAQLASPQASSNGFISTTVAHHLVPTPLLPAPPIAIVARPLQPFLSTQVAPVHAPALHPLLVSSKGSSSIPPSEPSVSSRQPEEVKDCPPKTKVVATAVPCASTTQVATELKMLSSIEKLPSPAAPRIFSPGKAAPVSVSSQVTDGDTAQATKCVPVQICIKEEVNHSVHLQQSYLKALRELEDGTKSFWETGVDKPRQLGAKTTGQDHTCRKVNGATCPSGPISSNNATNTEVALPEATLAAGYQFSASVISVANTAGISGLTNNQGLESDTVLSPVKLDPMASQQVASFVKFEVPLDTSTPAVSHKSIEPSTSLVNHSSSSGIVPGAVGTITQVEPSTSSPVGFPDLLAGFDQVSPQCQLPILSHSLTYATEHQYSPTFTSRSFDDFHRLLGQEDLVPLSEAAIPPPGYASSRTNTSAETQQQVTRTSLTLTGISQPLPGGAELTAADAYAIFARQSAPFVYEHSNDMQPIASFEPSTEQLFYSDLSGMLKERKAGESITQNFGERGVKREFEQQLPEGTNEISTRIKSKRERYIPEEGNRVATGGDSGMVFSGGDPNLVSEASNSDSGSARGSLEDVFIS